MNFSENLFNKSDVGITTGYFINILGNQSAAAGYAVSGLIPASANDVFTHKFNAGKLATNTTFTYHDAAGTKLGYASGTVSGDTLTATIAVPNNINIKSIRVNFIVADIAVFMLVKGATYPTVYQNYGEASLKDAVVFSPSQITKIQSVASANKLYGKIITFDGDSICYGAGYTGGYGKIIADRNGMIYENKGVSGATVASGTAATHQISQTVSALRSDADYVIFEGLVNDKSIIPAVALGVMTNGYADTYDHTTALGGMEYMFSQAVARFPGKKIGFILVHRLWANTDDFHTIWYPAIKAVCQKWGVSLCDLYSEIPSLNLIAALKSAYTKNGDGWHPNQLGYEKYYCDKIEDWLRSL